ncbi:hypothetical protein NW762_008177 [Fusarium torreyae]|uniref:Apple domain-containing protein n=1 Tax=Fusarium torreyae TaxID=1237075 RepID=A0A9W8VCW0_9HYPO|nr:hypothetical protein NW762_008177 [Fusarium torreyae]
MQFKILVLAALHGMANAQQNVLTETFCRTFSGQSSIRPVPSTTFSETLTFTLTTRACPTVTRTVNRVPVTVTNVNTFNTTTTSKSLVVTGNSTRTITASTSTVFLTTSTTTNTTVVVTVTATTATTPTQTIPASSGFTALADEPDYVARKKRSVEGRLVHDLERRQTASRFPTSVRCLKLVETRATRTITPGSCTSVPTRTSTVTAPARTVTAQRTVTNTRTITVTAGTNTTITTTFTPTVSTLVIVTVPITMTNTTTATSTSTAPPQVTYAACSQNNLVSSANGGNPFVNIVANSGGTQNGASGRTANTAYDCCVLCQQASNCIFSYYDNRGGCILIIGDTCNPQDNHGTSFQTSPNGSNYVLSNGPCGRVANAGPLDLGGGQNPDNGTSADNGTNTGNGTAIGNGTSTSNGPNSGTGTNPNNGTSAGDGTSAGNLRKLA